MGKEIKRGKQKIEMKLIESETARITSFSKRKKTLFQDAAKLATRSGADVGVMMFSPSGKPFSYGSKSIEDLIENFFDVKLEDRQCDHAEGKSNAFEAFEDIRKDLLELKEKEKKQILMHTIMHRGSEIPKDKNIEEQKLAIMLRVKKIIKETKNAIVAEHLKFNLNVAAEPEEEKSS